MIRELPDGTMMAAYGPMLTTIRVVRSGSVCTRSALAGVREAFALQEQLARFEGVIRRGIRELDTDRRYPQVVNRMIASARRAQDPSVTPLIAVAGTVADLVAERVFADPEVSLVIVNNGGDIALRRRGDQPVRIGIRPAAAGAGICRVLRIEGDCAIGGVATSGLGGRSFTTGIASAAVAAAESASVADVAATLIGNAVDVDSDEVTRVRARELDPDTDIPDHRVTVCVGALSAAQVETALAGGLARADDFARRGLIAGALVALRGSVRATDSLSALLCAAGHGDAAGGGVAVRGSSRRVGAAGLSS